jgi:hypothetical protein
MASRRTLSAEVSAAVADLSRVDADAALARVRSELADMKARYSAALRSLDAERSKSDALAGLQGLDSVGGGVSGRLAHTEATAVIVLSDWHVEEHVDPATVSGLNEFTLEIADRRIAELRNRFSKLVEHERGLAKIDRIVVCALGDFISNIIHEDTAELAQLGPLAALRWAGERLRGFVDLASSLAKEVIVLTSTGNHGRTTMKPRVATENEHSFEQHLYLTMAEQEKNRNVRWVISPGYLNTVDLQGFVLRAHHGHAIRYGGGVGGIAVPANKAISQWNRAARADLDVFGHWHQWSWINNRYVSNGSLIGHSAYAVRIKAEYEFPCQSFIVIDHGRNCVTRAMPIFCDKDLQEKRNGERGEHGRRKRTAEGRGGDEDSGRAGRKAGRGVVRGRRGG